MAATGTNLSTIKAALLALVNARTGISSIGVTMRYGPPQNADDVTSTDGDLEAIWYGDSAQADIEIPYMVGLTAKPTREEIQFTVVCQAVQRSEDGTTDGQQTADQRAEALLKEVLSELAEDPTVGLTTPRPLALVAERWTYQQLPRTSNAWGTRFELTLRTTPADIAAPS
jgi:hypothetical protein